MYNPLGGSYSWRVFLWMVYHVRRASSREVPTHRQVGILSKTAATLPPDQQQLGSKFLTELFFFALVLSQWPCLLCGCAHAGCVSGKKQCVVILLQLTTWSTNTWNETLDYFQSPSTLCHSFSCTLGRGWVVLEPIPAGLRWRRGYALVKSVVYHRIASEDAQPSITPVNNLELPSVDHLFVFVLWEETGKLGRNLCKQRENTQTPL